MERLWQLLGQGKTFDDIFLSVFIPFAAPLILVFLIYSLLSGQGKSTIIQLIEQFYRPTSGTVEYMGVNMAELNIAWCRQQIATVFQEPNLFDTTIAENIRFGCPEVAQADIEDAARKANAHNFIMEFPQRYQTAVGSGSSLQISGGQKQVRAVPVFLGILQMPFMW